MFSRSLDSFDPCEPLFQDLLHSDAQVGPPPPEMIYDAERLNKESLESYELGLIELAESQASQALEILSQVEVMKSTFLRVQECLKTAKLAEAMELSGKMKNFRRAHEWKQIVILLDARLQVWREIEAQKKIKVGS